MCKDINVNNKQSGRNESIKCKYCSNEDNNKIVRCGFSNLGKQRYKCRICGKTFMKGEDKRIKHSIEERKLCLTLYLNGTSMRGIEKILNTYFKKKIYIRNIVYWIKNSNKILELKDEDNKKNSNNKDNKKGLVIMEMDELYTYIKKNPKIILENHILIKENEDRMVDHQACLNGIPHVRSLPKEYGLLLIGTKVS